MQDRCQLEARLARVERDRAKASLSKTAQSQTALRSALAAAKQQHEVQCSEYEAALRSMVADKKAAEVESLALQVRSCGNLTIVHAECWLTNLAQ